MCTIKRDGLSAVCINIVAVLVTTFMLIAFCPASAFAEETLSKQRTTTVYGSFSDYFSCQVHPDSFWCPRQSL